MKTKSVSSRSIFTGQDGLSLKLRKNEEAYGLGAGDRITTENGTFELQQGTFEYWNLALVGATSIDLKPIDTSPITRENWKERFESLSPAERITIARTLGIA
jgi:hypothetical protein